MGYRITNKEHHHHKPQRNVIDASTSMKVYAQNGVKTRIAIPCWYVEVLPPKRAHFHDRCHHDHIGWPSPSHPDHICQHSDFAHAHSHHHCGYEAYDEHHRGRHQKFLDPDLLVPIHFLSESEGYSKTPKVYFGDNKPAGISATATIDENEDWIIRVTFDIKTPAAATEEIEVPFSVFAENAEKRDIVTIGTLVVLPGPIGQ